MAIQYITRAPGASGAGPYAFDIDALPQLLTYAGPGGAVDTITAGPDPSGVSFKQTLTYTGSNVTGISPWTKV